MSDGELEEGELDSSDEASELVPTPIPIPYKQQAPRNNKPVRSGNRPISRNNRPQQLAKKPTPFVFNQILTSSSKPSAPPPQAPPNIGQPARFGNLPNLPPFPAGFPTPDFSVPPPPLNESMVAAARNMLANQFPNHHFPFPPSHEQNTVSSFPLSLVQTASLRPSQSGSAGFQDDGSNRTSVDMDISPMPSPSSHACNGMVVEVNEPIEGDFPGSSSTTFAPLAPPPMAPLLLPPPPSAPSAKQPPMKKRKQRKKTRRVASKFISESKEFLLASLNTDYSSESDSDANVIKEEKEIEELRRRIQVHSDSMHAEIKRRDKLVKEMEACQLMISHHFERMNDILHEMGEINRGATRRLRKKNSTTRSLARRRLTNLKKSIRNRIDDYIGNLKKAKQREIMSGSEDEEETVDVARSRRTRNRRSRTPSNVATDRQPSSSNTFPSTQATAPPAPTQRNSDTIVVQVPAVVVKQEVRSPVASPARTPAPPASRRDPVAAQGLDLSASIRLDNVELVATPNTIETSSSTEQEEELRRKLLKRRAIIVNAVSPNNENSIIDATQEQVSQRTQTEATPPVKRRRSAAEFEKAIVELRRARDKKQQNVGSAVDRPKEDQEMDCMADQGLQDHWCNTPLAAIRTSILSPDFPVKKSVERFRMKIDPEKELCYFELFGTCIDSECPYQHFKDFTLSDQQIIEEVLSYIPERRERGESIAQQAEILLQKASLVDTILSLRAEFAPRDFITAAIG